MEMKALLLHSHWGRFRIRRRIILMELSRLVPMVYKIARYLVARFIGIFDWRRLAGGTCRCAQLVTKRPALDIRLFGPTDLSRLAFGDGRTF